LTGSRHGKRKDIRLNRLLRKMLDKPWFEFSVRWILGITFIYASWHKITGPADFAKIIYGYQLVPDYLINLIAIFLPFVELFTGIALISGIYVRSSSLIILCMLFFFIVAISINLIRGHEFDCGCFSPNKAGYFNSVQLLLFRDLIYFILGIYLILYSGSRKKLI